MATYTCACGAPAALYVASEVLFASTFANTYRVDGAGYRAATCFGCVGELLATAPAGAFPLHVRDVRNVDDEAAPQLRTVAPVARSFRCKHKDPGKRRCMARVVDCGDYCDEHAP